MKAKIGYGIGYLIALTIVSATAYYLSRWAIDLEVYRECFVGFVAFCFLYLNKNIDALEKQQKTIIKNQHYIAEAMRKKQRKLKF